MELFMKQDILIVITVVTMFIYLNWKMNKEDLEDGK